MYNFSIVVMCNIMQMYPTIFGGLGTKMRFGLDYFSVRFLCVFCCVWILEIYGQIKTLLDRVVYSYITT